jgi:choline dehydrogenase-like flavoprotein
MLIDARDIASGTTRPYDLCVVGAGAAGITLARRLRAERFSIALVESGGFTFDPATQDLYQGTTLGPGLSGASYLSTSRLRFFGGTTNHWGGWCRPLDPLDFETRAWVPHSGWPIGRAELAPYFEEAAGVVQIVPFTDALEAERVRDSPSLLPGDLIVTKRMYTSPPTRFGTEYRKEIVEAPQVDVILHANVVRIETNEAGSSVRAVRVATLGGRQFSVTAKAFVLAAGGIENARLLLASDGVQKSGLGNQGDAVGRYFMEHPECPVGHIYVTGDRDVLETYRTRRGSLGLLCLSDRAQREHELLNASFQLGSSGDLPLPSEAGGVPLAIGPAIEALDRVGEKGAPDEERQYVGCYVRAEAAPNPTSRLTLVRETDQLGMRRVNLAWRMGQLESRTIQHAIELLATELGRTGRGRMFLLYDRAAREVSLGRPPWRGVHGGSHHMGTTRMSDSPKTGVVDTNGRVHGVANLYVAGSSVFPTVGFANPTFTIIALALRLARHLPGVVARA